LYVIVKIGPSRVVSGDLRITPVERLARRQLDRKLDRIQELDRLLDSYSTGYR